MDNNNNIGRSGLSPLPRGFETFSLESVSLLCGSGMQSYESHNAGSSFESDELLKYRVVETKTETIITKRFGKSFQKTVKS